MPGSGNLHMSDGTGTDQLFVPAGHAPGGTAFRFERVAGSAHQRRVSATAPVAVAGATIAIDATGCTPAPTKRLKVGRWDPATSTWQDVGGTLTGTTVTSDPLDHLSIYAVVSN
jgi:hypothetical protein